jgi:hypothetical protein
MQSLPVSVAFCGIMYTAPVYSTYIPALARLLIGANAIHQLTMTLLSTMPFIVGQVRTAGQLDLSLIAFHCRPGGGSDASHTAAACTWALLPAAIAAAIRM